MLKKILKNFLHLYIFYLNTLKPKILYLKEMIFSY